MEQSPTNRVTFHLRIVNLLAILLITDSVLANHAINVTLTKGPNMMIMFGFEVRLQSIISYVILTNFSIVHYINMFYFISHW